MTANIIATSHDNTRIRYKDWLVFAIEISITLACGVVALWVLEVVFT